ncbi:unnamed protein product [Periconia digitata]|uniref:Secreted protein n=1 Tax=Periconia digitata TaxID=1303443 RepID=A0A9W4UHZ4_9PLEO|nr:unnamed protein product [Periconia digitata]
MCVCVCVCVCVYFAFSSLNFVVEMLERKNSCCCCCCCCAIYLSIHPTNNNDLQHTYVGERDENEIYSQDGVFFLSFSPTTRETKVKAKLKSKSKQSKLFSIN